MNLAADLGGIFIILDLTALTFAPIINIRQVGLWETVWIMISSEEATGLAGFVYFRSRFENVYRRRRRETI